MFAAAAAAAKSLQSCLTLCDPIDGNPPGFPVPGILQARTLEWVAISFSNAWKWEVKVKSLSRSQLLATPWTAAYQAPPSMGFTIISQIHTVQNASLKIWCKKLLYSLLGYGILKQIVCLSLKCPLLTWRFTQVYKKLPCQKSSMLKKY